MLKSRRLLGIVSVGFIALAKKMSGVGEDYVASQLVPWSIINVKGRIGLEIAGDVAGEADGDGILGTALPIHLGAPGLIEIVSVTEDRFILVTGVDGAGDELVVLGIVSRFEERLRVGAGVR